MGLGGVVLNAGKGDGLIAISEEDVFDHVVDDDDAGEEGACGEDKYGEAE